MGNVFSDSIRSVNLGRHCQSPYSMFEFVREKIPATGLESSKSLIEPIRYLTAVMNNDASTSKH